MLHVELDEEEIALLKELIDEYLSDLRSEIMATDNLDYKMMLKMRKFLLLKIQYALNETELEPIAG